MHEERSRPARGAAALSRRGLLAGAAAALALLQAGPLLAAPSREAVAEALAALPERELIVYQAQGQRRHTITVFTDVRCPYCRALHRNLQAYREAGIRVRYAAFPLSERSRRIMERVWCSDEPREALEWAMAGGEVQAASCSDAPVAEHRRLGERIGVSGTPALVTPEGRVLGMLPLEELLSLLSREE
ncbi:thioredoxin fold domain-containing protein [Halorhodospira neutriphila]|uniref:Thiol:disulfide interchange protein n=1 Tax=Halorhodospira neutriphila TaxID=168379 RepID=A0ABS1E507_9GAMM|nr:thioredoxin fold domain-containing protein [Halorhodospira neutriphila]MBK1726043.1 hypothetical protein [Halorhodospira neutriphila]